ncbi:hypothetical protein [Halocynthiibacter namhaensis]|uniref:hypothetical protein n=1 Tax=Halocynthiibacter namhaensis TaxID=1290553 RepID=UPI00057965CD|nr:hypothetical protein [Halocynthiibacter namhaensis]
MSRKPVDQRNKANKPQGQDGVWLVIRRLKQFTVTNITDETGINRKTVTDYVKRLEAGKYLAKQDDFEVTKRFTLIRDGGVHAPRLKLDGKPVVQGTGNLNMWRTIRMVNQFNPRDLALQSSTDEVGVTEATARTYCTMLLKAGYLRVLQKAVPNKRQAIYKLIRNTGPLPPQIQRVKQVYDPNIKEVVYYPPVVGGAL